MKQLRFAALALAAFLCAAGQSAEAGCYQGIGCTAKDHFSPAKLQRLSCFSLGFLRNSIFAEKGYCFRKAEYRELFANNTRCRFESADDVPLTRIERANIRAIYEAERQKDCPD